MREHVSTKSSKRVIISPPERWWWRTKLFTTLLAKGLIIFSLFASFLFGWRVCALFMMVLFLPLPCFHQYNPSCGFFFLCHCTQCTESSHLGQQFVWGSEYPALWCHPGGHPWCCHPKATQHLRFGIATAESGCFVLLGIGTSATPLKDVMWISKNIYKGGKLCYSCAITAVPEFQLHGWMNTHPISSHLHFYAVFDYFLRM